MTENRDAATGPKVDVPPELGAKLIRGEITLGEFLGLSPSALYAIARLGHQLLSTGKLESALAIYKGLVQASPYDSVFHCHLGATLYAMGEHEEAIKSYSKAIQFNKANPDALAGRGELYLRANKVTEGLADLKAAIEADPQAKRASTLRARATLQMIKEAAEKQRAARESEAKPASKEKPADAKSSSKKSKGSESKSGKKSAKK